MCKKVPEEEWYFKNKYWPFTMNVFRQILLEKPTTFVLHDLDISLKWVNMVLILIWGRNHVDEHALYKQH